MAEEKRFLPAFIFLASLCATAPSLMAGDFSNPEPFSLDGEREMSDTAERLRLALSESFGSVAGGGQLRIGDHYERYQSGMNWNNAVLSGNTIILNGDNNTVTLTTGESEITQTSNNACLNTRNTFLNSGGSTGTDQVMCDIVE